MLHLNTSIILLSRFKNWITIFNWRDFLHHPVVWLEMLLLMTVDARGADSEPVCTTSTAAAADRVFGWTRRILSWRSFFNPKTVKVQHFYVGLQSSVKIWPKYKLWSLTLKLAVGVHEPWTNLSAAGCKQCRAYEWPNNRATQRIDDQISGQCF